jgi:hypothetical protein
MPPLLDPLAVVIVSSAPSPISHLEWLAKLRMDS